MAQLHLIFFREGLPSVRVLRPNCICFSGLKYTENEVQKSLQNIQNMLFMHNFLFVMLEQR